MKKLLTVTTLLLLILTGCQNSETTITVVATATPHAEILYEARPLLKTKGFNLTVEVINNYALGNPAVSSGSADANYFQHIPYFNSYNESAKAEDKLANVASIHIEPIGLYAGSKDSISALADDDVIVISDNAPDYGRIVKFLAEIGVVTPVADFVATNTYADPEEAIATKSVDFKFQIIEARLLVLARSNNEGAFFFINGNYALTGGLTLSDVLMQEPTTNNPYVNIVAVKVGSEASAKTAALVEVLTSAHIKDFINTKYDGTVVAV